MNEQDLHPALAASDQPRAFCRKCGYALVGLPSRCCPECGRTFDPANPRTFARRPPRGWLRRWGLRVAGVMLPLILAGGLGLAWLWWGWQGEQKTIGHLKQYGARMTITAIGPERLGGVLGTRLSYLRERVSRLDLSNRSAAEMDGIDFAALGHLHELYLEHCDLGSGLHENLGHARSVQRLEVRLEDRIKPDITFLENMTRLEVIYFEGEGIDDVAIRHVAKVKRLTMLSLHDTGVTDLGLDALKELPALEALYIWVAPITDEGLQRVSSLAALRTFVISGTSVSRRALEKLKRERPGMKIEGYSWE